MQKFKEFNKTAYTGCYNYEYIRMCILLKNHVLSKLHNMGTDDQALSLILIRIYTYVPYTYNLWYKIFSLFTYSMYNYNINTNTNGNIGR